MAYTPTEFVNDNPPPISAQELNKIGAGIAEAHANASVAQAAIDALDIRVTQTEPTTGLVSGKTVWISHA